MVPPPCFISNATPTNNIKYSCHIKAVKLIYLTNYTGFILCHSGLYLLMALGVDIHTHFPEKSNFKQISCTLTTGQAHTYFNKKRVMNMYVYMRRCPALPGALSSQTFTFVTNTTTLDKPRLF